MIVQSPRSRPRASSNLRPSVKPLPEHVLPMLATLGEMPAKSQSYGFEYKWDGVRAICYCEGGHTRFESRNLLDMTRRYPEFAGLAKTLRQPVILDGEIVALDEAGHPSFKALQRRMHVSNPPANLVEEVPAYLFVFDILNARGKSLMELPYTRRRDLLDELFVPGPSWKLSPVYSDGHAVLETARKHGLEGIVAKELDSTYAPGRRSPAWIKIKLVKNQEFVIGGWTPEKGERGYGIGSLLLGYYETVGRVASATKQLRFAGGVGSGFNGASAARMLSLLKSKRRATSPFADRIPKKDVTFVEPTIVVDVEYRRWPEGGQVQQAVFKGIRTDKPAADVVKEQLNTDG